MFLYFGKICVKVKKKSSIPIQTICFFAKLRIFLSFFAKFGDLSRNSAKFADLLRDFARFGDSLQNLAIYSEILRTLATHYEILRKFGDPMRNSRKIHDYIWSSPPGNSRSLAPCDGRLRLGFSTFLFLCCDG